MPFLNRNEKVTCENCGAQITKPSLAGHKKSCSAGTLFCAQCSNLSTNSRAEMNYHIVKKHSKATARVVHKCKMCVKDCHKLYNLREHKRKQHGAQRGSRA